MFFLQADTSKAVSHAINHLSSSDWSAIGAIAQAVIAIVNVCLAGYIFLYQRRQNNASERHTAELNEQNIKLQWFKELIMQPNMVAINSFYENLHTIKEKITTPDLSIAAKEDINNFSKAELAVLRKSFVDALLMVDKAFADQLLANLDNLIDGITDAIFNDELKLNNPTVYEKFIGSKISYSRNTLLAQLYNYKGITTT